MFRATRRLLQELVPERMQDRWILEVGASPTVSRSIAATRLLPLLTLEGVAPRIRLGAHADLLENLLEGELDLLISESLPAHPDEKRVASKPIASSPMVFYAHPDFAESSHGFPGSLGGVPLLSYSQGSQYRWKLDEFFFECGISPEILGEVDDVSLLVAAAQHSRCCIAVPAVVAEDAVRAGKLVELGPIQGAQSVIYAQYLQTKPTELVQKALSALQIVED